MSRRLSLLAVAGSAAVAGAFVWSCGGQDSGADGGNDVTTSDQSATDTGAKDATGDVSSDAGDASDGNLGPRCTASKPFGPITLVAELGGADGGSSGARLATDSLTVYFSAAGNPEGIISTATRSTTFGTFNTPTALTQNGSDAGFLGLDPSISPDGLAMYLQYNPGGYVEVRYATRPEAGAPFTASVGVNGLSGAPPNHGAPFAQGSSALWYGARVEPDGGATQGGGSLDIFTSQLVGVGAIVNASAVPEITTVYDETSPAITPDGLTIFFARKEATDGGASSTFHVYTTTRGSASDPFPAPTLVNELDDMPTTNTSPTWIAPDNCVIFLASDRGGPAGAIYTAVRPL